MKHASTVLITLILTILALVLFLHVHAEDHSFSLTSIPKVEKGMTESQRYVQYSGDPGSLLFGYRHQIKQVDMELPRLSLNFKSKTDFDLQAAKENPKEGKKREYTLGFSKWTTGEKSSDFYGSYTYVRFWVIELFLILLAAIVSLPIILQLIRKTDQGGVINSESLRSSP
ncbi:hypothetical protein [Rubritalea marina]|uniref:hypothetical protein n=1 Tax=Rubritalea marina TaxID=361055 RepID=UPI00037B781A|nr:hypothetical protein [Rubritalea marina]